MAFLYNQRDGTFTSLLSGSNSQRAWSGELLDLDRRRVLGWALAHAMLSACWDLESGMDWEIWIVIARALQAVHL
jgi:streptomycin 6-kinase